MTTTFSRGAQTLTKLVHHLSQLSPQAARDICDELGIPEEQAESWLVDVLTASHAIKRLSALNPEAARRIIDAVSDAEISDAIAACAEAVAARDGARDAFDESVAARLAGQSKAVAA